MRYSKQREAVLDALRSTTTHPSAEWVHSQVRQRIKNISLGTVYRNLRELEAAGRALMFCAASGIMHFDGDTSPHAHFVCNQCGQISDIFATSGLSEVLVGEGYRVDGEQLIFYGACRECQAEGCLDCRTAVMTDGDTKLP